MTINIDVLLPDANNDGEGRDESRSPWICFCPKGDIMLPDLNHRKYRYQRTLRIVNSLYFRLSEPKNDRTETQ